MVYVYSRKQALSNSAFNPNKKGLSKVASPKGVTNIKQTSSSRKGSKSGKVSASGEVAALPIEDAPKTLEAAMDQYADRKDKQAIAVQQQQQSQQQYFLTVGEKRVQVSKGLYDKVNADNAKAQTEKPYYAVTNRGATYAETGETVKSAQIRADKANAFNFLAPVEKKLAEKFGSKERIYNTVVTTKQKYAKEVDVFGQKAKKFWWIDEQGNQLGSGEFFKALPYRAKELGAQFKSGAFNMISAPVETAAIIIGAKMLPVAGSGSAYASGGVAAPAVISVVGAVRNPNDPLGGTAKTLGEASVVVAGSKALDLVGGKNIPRFGYENVEYKNKDSFNS